MQENQNESNQDNNTGYTGEYGNLVDGNFEDRNQTTYSYSYKDQKNESTSSGDYYEKTQSQEATAQNATGEWNQTAGASSQFNNETNNIPSENANNESQNSTTPNGNTGYGFSANQGNSNTQNGINQNGNYGYNQFYQKPNQTYSGNGAKPPKKQMSFGQKIGVTVACAVVFGLFAGVCFNGVNFISSRLFGTTTNRPKVESAETVKSNNTATAATSGAIGTNDVSKITEQCMPAIVAITSTSEGTDYYDLFGQYNKGQETKSSGTGFIVGQNKKELLIATNNHVISGAKTISIQFIDGQIYKATEKGTDESNDLAVVAVNLSSIKKETMNKIKIADLGSSKDVKVGEMVVAIGNALGYGQSVTVGYVSAKDREITESSENGQPENKIKAIQTDAAINPGNSGGALINMQGQVIGINSAKIAQSSVEGVGYAIPISVATPIIDDLMKREVLSDSEKGYLGITGTTVTEAASAYNVPYGVYVKSVAKGGAAQKGGVKPNDVITAVNKMEVTTIESLQKKVNSYKKGTEIELTVQRSDGGRYVKKKITVKLQGKESLDSLPDDNTTQNNNNPGNDQNNDNSDNNQGNNSNGSFWDNFFN